MPQISIIIPTINRYADLKNTIADLNKQSVTDFEIIIIDQTALEIAETITGKNIVYLHKTFKSASKARNVGLLEAKSPIVLFLDDDVIIENIYFLKAHLDNFEKDSQLSGVFGAVLSTKKDFVSKLPDKVSNEYLGWMYFPKNYDKPFKIGNGISCNLSVRKSYAIDIGGMDEYYYKGAHREESDFCFRLSKKYGKLNYDPKTYLIHIGNPNGGIRSWDDSRGIIHAKQHMFGSWYFMFRHLPWFTWATYSWFNFRRFILHKKLVIRFYFLPKALFSFSTTFIEAIFTSLKKPKLIEVHPTIDSKS